jgi:hypothetical protein
MQQIIHLLTYSINSLQLNIGIIAACASFLRPLVGRFLKLNTSAINYYQSGSNHNNKGSSTRPTLGTIGSSSYAAGRHGKGAHTIEDECDTDEFELHTKTADTASTSEDVRPLRSEGGNYMYGVTSDSRSDDLIIQKPEPARGIVRTRDVRVQYSAAE